MDETASNNAVLAAYDTEQYALALELITAQMNDHGYFRCAWIAADIIARNLDDGGHTPEEAAGMYWIAAKVGNADIYNWICTLLPPDSKWEDMTPAAIQDAIAKDIVATRASSLDPPPPVK
jgi:hypothetical protein